MTAVLSRERIIARPGFNRCSCLPRLWQSTLDRMAYGFSVFWLPLSRAVGVTQPIPCPDTMRLSSSGWWPHLRLEDQHPGVDVHLFFRVPRLLRGRCSGAGSSMRVPGSRRGAAFCWAAGS